MTFGSEMRELAVELTEEFSSEIGKSKLKHITSTTYNRITGQHDTTYSVEEAYFVFEDITEKEVKDASFRNKHRKATVAGSDLIIIPVVDDLVVTPEGTVHRIAKVLSDQYNAANILYIEKKHVEPEL